MSATRPACCPIRVEDGEALLDGADLLGIAAGDRYAVVAPGGDPSKPLGTAVVDRVVAGRARLTLEGTTVAAVPAGAAAHPLEVSLGPVPSRCCPPTILAGPPSSRSSRSQPWCGSSTKG